jgi:3',5'-cyclic-AMP phosphodiesterase
MLRIVQLSDTHIDNIEQPYPYNIDVKTKFTQTLHKITAYKPDLLILSGDLAAYQGEIAAYEWLAEQLDISGLPYVLMAGNHDNVVNMQEIFTLPVKVAKNGDLYFDLYLDNRQLLFLDSSVYTLEDRQLDWLQAQIKPNNLVFMHHPPTFCNCTYMDKNYALRGQTEVWQRLSNLDELKHIFCGHYHTGRSVYKQGKSIHICPSTMLQIATHTHEFAVASYNPGWRVIEWDEQYITTFVEYLI